GVAFQEVVKDRLVLITGLEFVTSATVEKEAGVAFVVGTNRNVFDRVVVRGVILSLRTSVGTEVLCRRVSVGTDVTNAARDKVVAKFFVQEATRVAERENQVAGRGVNSLTGNVV